MEVIKSLAAAKAQAQAERKESGCVRHVNAVIYEVRDAETREVIGHKIGGYQISDFCDASTIESY